MGRICRDVHTRSTSTPAARSVATASESAPSSVMRRSIEPIGQICASAVRVSFSCVVIATTTSARETISALTPDSPRWRPCAPPSTVSASTPRNSRSKRSLSSTRSAYGPNSSYDSARATPPTQIVRRWGRSTISVAMFNAFVTTVTWSSSVLVISDSRADSARATAVVVVPPLSATTLLGTTSSAAASATRCLCAGVESARYLAGRSYATDVATMPPCVRVASCCSARAAKSRRIVAADTPNSRAASSTPRRPRSATRSSSRRHRSARLTRSGSVMVRSLDAPGGEARDQATLDQGEQDHDGHDTHDRHREHVLPGGCVLPDELRQRDRQRLVLSRRQDDQTRGELVPAGDDGEDRCRHDARPDQRKRDLAQGLQPAEPIESGSLLDLFGHGREEAVHDPRRERQVEGTIDQDHRQPRVVDAELEKLPQQASRQHGRLQHLGREYEQQERHPPREASACRVVRRRDRDSQHQQRRAHGDDDRADEVRSEERRVGKECRTRCAPKRGARQGADGRET